MHAGKSFLQLVQSDFAVSVLVKTTHDVIGETLSLLFRLQHPDSLEDATDVFLVQTLGVQLLQDTLQSAQSARGEGWGEGLFIRFFHYWKHLINIQNIGTYI